jgi:hypothetical protein
MIRRTKLDGIKSLNFLISKIEERSPWLSRSLLGVASNMTEPFLLAMGLSVERVEEDLVEVWLPDWWRNRGEEGVVHNGAIASLGEFAVRKYWDHHLTSFHSRAEAVNLQFRRLGVVKGALRGTFYLATSERESFFQKLRANQSATINCETNIYDKDGRLVAQVEMQWQMDIILELKGK